MPCKRGLRQLLQNYFHPEAKALPVCERNPENLLLCDRPTKRLQVRRSLLLVMNSWQAKAVEKRSLGVRLLTLDRYNYLTKSEQDFKE